MALIRIGRSYASQLSCYLAHQLFVDPLDNHVGWIRNIELDPLRRVSSLGMSEAQLEVECLPLHLGSITNASYL
jgi:hypothetical protein